MLKTLDVFIGLATVMLFFSLAVTVLTQMATSLLNSRGKCLLYGIERLLRQVWPKLEAGTANTIAQFLLRHPSIAVKDQKLGSVIQREEMVFLLLEGAAGECSDPLKDQAKTVLCQMLAQSGITDPAKVLIELRSMTQDLQRLRPELSAPQQKSMAILNAAAGEFTAKLFGWFDQTIDRVSDAFTQHTRFLSLGGAVVVVLLFQIDSIWIVQRLSADDKVRAEIVAQAQPLSNQAKELLTPNAESGTSESSQAKRVTAPNAQSGGPQSDEGKKKPTDTSESDKARAVLETYGTDGLIQMPSHVTPGDWLSGWASWHRIAGSVLSVLLLSLGAPFWYDALKNMIKLRSVLSGRDDEQRDARQAPDSAVPSPGSGVGVFNATTSAAIPMFDLTGERGDLTAVG